MIREMLTGLKITARYMFRRPITNFYPEEKPMIPPRWRGRIVLTSDPDGEERCVACYLCQAVCPVQCIDLQAENRPDGRRVAKRFDINFARCIFCGFCEEACPTYSIQLTPDFEMATTVRTDLVYHKEDLQISGTGKHPNYSFWQVSGVTIKDKEKGEAINEAAPSNYRSNLP
ncbi:MAG: NADH-quinone oxidoreductase subunit NuoI [Candidatus Sumerlaeaceae bacterium]|nr:NADH-quinone oxidoreductase subunit NuoI [Candidatus Sumerlaeaceae bacterium]